MQYGRAWRGLAAAALGLGALALVACDGASTDPKAPSFPHAVLTPAPKALNLAPLQAPGVPWDWSKLRGRWSWVYFGYGNCPDVCPTALSNLAANHRALLAPQAVQVVFVSVDPDRDRPEKLRDYVRFYDPSFMGLSGTRANVDAVTKAFGATYVIDKPATAGADFNYPVSHTNLAFVLNPEGQLVAAYAPEAGKPDDMAQDFNAILAPAKP